jgi:uncharacterized protein YegJ (DUF2314 family)
MGEKHAQHIPSWSLSNCALIAQLFPTFYRPSDRLISKVKIGDLVRLGFQYSDAPVDQGPNEKMWVEIEQIDGHGNFVGCLMNQSFAFDDLFYGDTISFSAENICNTTFDYQEAESIPPDA